MSGGHYENIKNANLFDCLSIAQTRIVPSNLRNVPAGYSEVPLVFHLKPEMVKKLTFKVPWGGIVYGFVNSASKLKEKLGLNSAITDITVSDWDGRFVLIFETESEADSVAFNVEKADVIKLLSECRKPAEM